MLAVLAKGEPYGASCHIILSITAIGREGEPGGAQVLQVTVSQCWIWHVLLSWSGEGLDGPSKTQETVEIFPPLVVADFEWLDHADCGVPSVISDELRAQLAIHHVNAISIVSSGIVIE